MADKPSLRNTQSDTFDNIRGTLLCQSCENSDVTDVSGTATQTGRQLTDVTPGSPSRCTEHATTLQTAVNFDWQTATKSGVAGLFAFDSRLLHLFSKLGISTLVFWHRT